MKAADILEDEYVHELELDRWVRYLAELHLQASAFVSLYRVAIRLDARSLSGLIDSVERAPLDALGQQAARDAGVASLH